MRLELVALLAAWTGTICLFVMVPWTVVRVVSAVLETGEARIGRQRVKSAHGSSVVPTETTLVTSEEPSVDRAGTSANANRSDTDRHERGIKT